MACMISIVTNLAIGIHGNKGQKFTTPMDYMPDWSGEKEDQMTQKQSVEEMAKVLKEIAAAAQKSKRVPVVLPPPKNKKVDKTNKK